ncbi:hypothetical protein A2U01_0057342, partial [Trifolium medium]|nr:hypothetical protein [Trifolium medium]
MMKQAQTRRQEAAAAHESEDKSIFIKGCSKGFSKSK